MRHKVASQRFSRSPNARKALIRGLVNSLVEHGRIKTTVAKAKELRRHVERAVTLAKKETLGARRVLLSRYPNKNTVDTLMTDLAPRFKTRPGGYTRVVKLGIRPGDAAEMALIEFVDYQPKTDVVEPKAAKKKTAKATAETSEKKEVKAKKKTAKKE